MSLYSYQLSGKQGLTFPTSVATSPPKLNWLLMETNGSIDLMNSAGAIVMNKNTLLEIILTVDLNELKTSGAGTLSFQVIPASGAAPYMVSCTPFSGSYNFFRHVLDCKIGDKIAPFFTFATGFVMPAIDTVNATFRVTDKAGDMTPVSWIGLTQNAPPMAANLPIRYYFTKSVLSAGNGKITFFLTNSGLASGVTLFPNNFLVMANASPAASQALATNAVSASEDSRATDNSWVTIVVTVGTVTGILLGGAVSSSQFAPNGTQVSIWVVGY